MHRIVWKMICVVGLILEWDQKNGIFILYIILLIAFIINLIEQIIIRNAQNYIINGSVQTTVKAVGASIESGVGREFFKANGSHHQLTYMPQMVTVTGGAVSADPNVVNGVKLFNNVREWQSTYYSNTSGLGSDARPDSLIFNFSIPDGVLQNLEILVYFFMADDNSWQVRTYGAPPTENANMALFASFDDNSPTEWSWNMSSAFSFPRTGSNAFYRTANFHPWAIEFIATDFKVPFEKTSILLAYPMFQTWAESGGTQNRTWYSSPANEHIYIPTY